MPLKRLSHFLINLSNIIYIYLEIFIFLGLLENEVICHLPDVLVEDLKKKIVYCHVDTDYIFEYHNSRRQKGKNYDWTIFFSLYCNILST